MYQAISSNVLLSSLSANRRKNFAIHKNTLRKNVIINNKIKFLCFFIQFVIINIGEVG
jgi:hypothetical protein